MEFSNPISDELLMQAGLSRSDIEQSIRFAAALNEAVKIRREALRDELGPPRGEQEAREERSDDDRIFTAAALLLAQRARR